MLPSLDNFVSYGTDVFRARPDYRQKALDIYTTTLSSEHLGENDRVNGCKLAESILLNPNIATQAHHRNCIRTP